ncbi:MAG TPA: TonB-dependent receptor plug domain-containing protein [Candidatus Didemnitutus sp.]|nr:TonB-dependent receptor plug domain-containing protein [Candidatus Didemnitutus sp.]
MNRTGPGILQLLALTSFFGTALMPAQTAPANTAAPGESDAAVVKLDPFVVSGTEDTGYTARDTLAGTRVRTQLKDVASAISVVTKQFLDDVGATNAQDLLVYTANTEVGGINGNFSGQAGIPSYNEALINPGNTTRVRGLDTADNTRDYFLTDIPWDSFNTGRIDLQRGPNSILFGVGSPAGIINASLDDAAFKNQYQVENRVDGYGSLRNSVSLNQVVIPGQLAIRVAALDDRRKYEQKPAFNNESRVYAALRWDPNLFGADNHTSFRVKYENGSVRSDNPRALPPVDEITPWFQSGTNAYGNAGYNKLTINQYTPGHDSASAQATSTYNLGSWYEGRTYYPDVLTYYNGVSNGSAPAASSNAPTNVIGGQISKGYGIGPSGAIDGGIDGLPNYQPLGIPPFSQYAANAPVPIPGGSYYDDRVLTDPSVFDFYKQLLDGNNKREWQGWHAANLALSQTFLHDRLGLELVYDQQDYNNGQVSFLQGANYGISVDVNETLADGSPNPNVGRPYVANSFWSSSNSNKISRHSLRLTATGEIRASDFLGNTTLAKVLGRHVFTGLLEEDNKKTMAIQWSQYATTSDWTSLLNFPANTLTSYRQFDWVDYIGPSLMGASSPAGANLSRVASQIAPTSSSVVRYFNSHWNATGVDPSTPYTYTNYTTGAVVNSTQSENPANYAGWQNTTVNWLNADVAAQFPDLVTAAQKTRYRDLSRGFTWQGYMLDGDLVPTVGWRRDVVTSYATGAPSNATSGLVSLDFNDDPKSRNVAAGESLSWGGVYHLPKAVTKYLPGGTTLSVFYDRSSNFKADTPRQNLVGETVANPNGKTKEYGFTVGTFDDRLTLKVDWFHTKVTNATFANTNGNSIAGLGSNGYLVWGAPDWGLGFAAQLQDYLEGRNLSRGGEWNYAAIDGVPGASAGPGNAAFDNAPQTLLSHQIVDAWLHAPVTNSFFQYYGIHPLSIDVTQLSTGEIRNVFGAGYDSATFQPGSENWSGASNAVSTVDIISRGTEYELDFKPVKNWNVTVNYSRTFATHENIDDTTRVYMNTWHDFLSGPAGQLRLWGSSAGFTVGPTWIQGVYNPYLVEVNSQGQSAPEVAPWRLNGITTYAFDHGALKGLFVGGAARLEAGRIEGYHYSAALQTLDVTNPWYGPNDTHVDLWLGYRMKVRSDLEWKVQLNLRNVGEKTRLVPSYYEPDGSIALARIQEGMTWELSNTLTF